MNPLPCLAILVSSVCLQQGPVPDTPRGKILKVRKIFVPQESVQKFIKGRYLPVEIEKLDSFMGKRSQTKSGFVQAIYELKWDPEEGLAGKVNLQIPESEAEKSIEFESSLQFSNLESPQTEFHFGHVGRAQTGQQVLFAIAGTKFRCDVSLPESSLSRSYRIVLPKSEKRSLSISVPAGFYLRSNQVFLPVSEIPDGEPLYRKYDVEPVGDILLVDILPVGEPVARVSSREVLSIEGNRANWKTRFELPISAFNPSTTQLTVPSTFECSAASVNGMEIGFEEVQRNTAVTIYRLNVPFNLAFNRSLNFEIDWAGRFNRKNSFQYRPIQIAGFENIASRLEFQQTGDWGLDQVQVSGFRVSRGQGTGNLVFDRMAKTCQIVFVPGSRPERKDVQRVEIDFRDGEITTRQLFTGLRSKAVVEINGNWTVQHAIDVFQDDLPIEFQQRKMDSRGIVLLENENASVWVEASRKIDPTIEYGIDDFLLSNMQNGNPLVEFKTGFVNGFGDGVRNPFGLPKENRIAGIELVRLDQIRLARFRWPADRQKFQADFDYTIKVDLEHPRARLDYHLFWNSQTHRTAIIELDLDASTTVNFPAGQFGSARILSRAEKQRLGLAIGRRYWALESHQREIEQRSHVIFSATGLLAGETLDVNLPRTIGEKEISGLVLLKGKDISLANCQSDDFIEIPVDVRQSQRAFEIAGGSLFKIQLADGDSARAQPEFSVLNREMVIDGSGKCVQTIKLISQHVFQWKIASESKIANVSATFGNRKTRGRALSGEWVVDGGSFPSLQEIELQVVFEKPVGLSVYRVPDLRINTRPVEMQCFTTVHEPLVVLPFDQLFADDFKGNLETVFWLPSLAFDTQTLQKLFSGNPNPVYPVLKDGKQNHALMIGKNGIIVFAFVVFSLFAFWATRMERNRTVLWFSMVSLFLSFLLSGVFALITSFVFWGFSCGLLLRELSRLCRLPAVTTGAALVLCFVGTGSHGIAQEPTVASEEKPSERIVTAIIPIDENEKPLGIAYLPEEFYKRISLGSRVKQGLVCREMKFEVLAETTPTRFAAAVRMEISKGQEGTMVLPFFAANAVFDTNSVKIDGEIVSFRPDLANRKIEVQTEKSGEISVEINFLVPTAERADVQIQLPFTGLTTVTNRAQSGFNMKRPNNEIPYVRLKSNETQQLGVFGSFVIRAIPNGGEKVTVIEMVDLDRRIPLHTVQVIPEKTFMQNFVFGIQDKRKLVNDTGYLKLNRAFSKEISGDKFLSINFRSEENGFVDKLTVPSLLPLNHEIVRYLVLVKSTDQVLLDDVKSFDDDSLKNDTVELWNRNSNNQLAADSIVVCSEVYPNSPKVISRFTREPELRCSANHSFFVGGERVRVRSAFDISCESEFEAFRVEVPTHYLDIEFNLGGQNLDWIRVDEKTIVVFMDVRAPVRSLVEFKAEFPVLSEKFVVGEPAVESTGFASSNRIYTNRERKVLSENISASDEMVREEGFLLVGSVQDLQQGIVTRQENALQGLSVKERVYFEPGKVRHRLVLDTGLLEKGSWVGIELPEGSVVPQGVTGNEMVQVERSDIFGQTQLWFPVTGNKNDEIEIHTSIEGNRVQLCRFVNVGSVSRLTELPNSIGEDSLVWDLAGAAEVLKTTSTSLFQTDRARLFAKFQTIEIPEKKAAVLFSESKYKVSERRLLARFYVAPNENDEIRIRLPGKQILESIDICGLPRAWQDGENGMIRVQLLSRRHLQVVDLSLLLKTEQQDSINIVIPELVGVGRYQRFFQCDEDWNPTGVTVNHEDDLQQMRNEFVTAAIEIFELNQDGATGWANVLTKYLEMNPAMDSNENEFALRIQQAVGQSSRKIDVNVLAELCSNDNPIYEVTENAIGLSKVPLVADQGPRLQVMGVVFLVALFPIFIGRLPRRHQTVLYSFLLACVIWVLGLKWLSLTPGSILAWCWILFGVLFGLLFVIDFLRYQPMEVPRSKKILN